MNEVGPGTDPIVDLDKYLTGVTNRLSLINSEEIPQYIPKIERLRDVISELLGRDSDWPTGSTGRRGDPG